MKYVDKNKKYKFNDKKERKKWQKIKNKGLVQRILEAKGCKIKKAVKMKGAKWA
jgi:hypothetical protein